jgi:hypothetical protein
VFSWHAHGTASMLVSMFPPSSLAWLQTGFRMPELYTLAMVRGPTSFVLESDQNRRIEGNLSIP